MMYRRAYPYLLLLYFISVISLVVTMIWFGIQTRSNRMIDPWIILRTVDVQRLVTVSDIAAITNRYRFRLDGSQAPPGVRVYFDNGEHVDTTQTLAEYIGRIERETGEPVWRSWMWATERTVTPECYYSGIVWLIDRTDAHFVYADPEGPGSIVEIRFERAGPPPSVEDRPITVCETIGDLHDQRTGGYWP